MLQTYTEDMIPLTMEDKKKVHQQGLWHKVVSALVMNETHIFLQTIYPKESYGFERPDYLDISVGGHIEDAEKEEAALLREAKEELGLTQFNSIEFIRIRKINCDPAPTYKIREFQYLYRIHVEKELKDFDLTDADPEVKSIVALEKELFLKLLKKEIDSITASEAIYDQQTRELREIKNRTITLDDFIPDYLDQHLFELILE
jgi:8-oxo-dGTP pyrophosphatase MutT (NUDIX family)